VDGSRHQGFHVDDGAYETFARNFDPLGDDARDAGAKHLAPNTDLAGDGFSAMGGESGFSGTYAGRMRGLRERVDRLGGSMTEMGDAARRTDGNFQGLEDDNRSILNTFGRDLA